MEKHITSAFITEAWSQLTTKAKEVKCIEKHIFGFTSVPMGIEGAIHN